MFAFNDVPHSGKCQTPLPIAQGRDPIKVYAFTQWAKNQIRHSC